MPRSPLNQLVARVARAARLSKDANVPLDVAWHRLQQARARGLRRRDVLKGAGLLAVAPLLKACPTPTPPPLAGNKKVAVVGAGMAGLHCAHRLKGLGITATV